MRKLRQIVCVDDDEDILEITKLSLELQNGLVVKCCRSGQEALDWIAHSSPDVILLDAMMPQMDGPETYAQICKLDSSLPVIFLTARVQEAEVNEYLEMGAIGVLAKPFDPIALFGQIQQIWEAGGKKRSVA